MSDRQHRHSSPHGSSRGGAASNKTRQGAAHKTAGSVVQQGKRSDSGHDTQKPRKLETRDTDSHKDETKADSKTGDKKAPKKDVINHPDPKRVNEAENRRQAPQTLSMQELSTSLSEALKKIEKLERAENDNKQVIWDLKYRIDNLEDRNHQRG
jgi:hypothetical protein